MRTTIIALTCAIASLYASQGHCGGGLRTINTIIVHHTGDTNKDISAAEIMRYHTKDRGWNDIGYHYVIRRDGSIESGRPVEKVGAHALGRNAHSIGIALSGNTATAKQLISLQTLLKKLTKAYPIRSIERHHEECPGPSIPVEHYASIFINKKYAEAR